MRFDATLLSGETRANHDSSFTMLTDGDWMAWPDVRNGFRNALEQLREESSSVRADGHDPWMIVRLAGPIYLYHLSNDGTLDRSWCFRQFHPVERAFFEVMPVMCEIKGQHQDELLMHFTMYTDALSHISLCVAEGGKSYLHKQDTRAEDANARHFVDVIRSFFERIGEGFVEWEYDLDTGTDLRGIVPNELTRRIGPARTPISLSIFQASTNS